LLDQSQLPGAGHDAECTDHRNPFRHCDSPSSAFIDDERVGVNLFGQQDGGRFAGIEAEILVCRIVDDVDLMCGPDGRDDIRTRSWVKQLSPYRSGLARPRLATNRVCRFAPDVAEATCPRQ
jgi:hypothetical protein